MTRSLKFYRLTRSSILLVLGLFTMIYLTACGNAQAVTSQIQQTSGQQIVQEAQPEPEIPLPLPQDSHPSDQTAKSAPSTIPGSTPMQATAVVDDTVNEVSADAPVEMSLPADQAPTGAVPATEPDVAAVAPEAASSAPAPAAQPSAESRPEVGFQAPDFTLQTLDGQMVNLSALRGRPVVVSYWATWCVPCKEELPALDQLSREFGSSGVMVLTINAIEQDTVEQVQQTVGQLGLSLPVLLDQQDQFHNAYNQLFFPTSYFIDANGMIRFIKLGSASEAELRSNLEKLINNQL